MIVNYSAQNTKNNLTLFFDFYSGFGGDFVDAEGSGVTPEKRCLQWSTIARREASFQDLPMTLNKFKP